MCEPVTTAIASMSAQTMMAASLAVSVASAGANYMAQSAQAERSAEYAQQTRDAAVQSMLEENKDLNARERQERTAMALRNEEARKKAQSASSTANATSEAAGLSVDALLDDYERQYATYSDSQMQQLGYTTEQISRTREGLQAKADGRANQAYSRITPGPSLFGTLAGVGADAVGAYQKFSVRDPMTGDYTLS